MIEWFLIYAMKVGRETDHIVFMPFLKVFSNCQDFCTSVSSPTPMLFFIHWVISVKLDKGAEVSKTINVLWTHCKSMICEKVIALLKGELGENHLFHAHTFWPTRQDKHSTGLPQRVTYLCHQHHQRRWEAAKYSSTVIERGIHVKKGHKCARKLTSQLLIFLGLGARSKEGG